MSYGDDLHTDKSTPGSIAYNEFKNSPEGQARQAEQEKIRAEVERKKWIKQFLRRGVPVSIVIITLGTIIGYCTRNDQPSAPEEGLINEWRGTVKDLDDRILAIPLSTDFNQEVLNDLVVECETAVAQEMALLGYQ